MVDKATHDGCVPTQEWFVKKIVSSLKGLALDCGCGRGLWSKKLRQEGMTVVSSDLSIRRLKMCKSEGNDNVVIRASCTHLPFKPSYFDSVLFLEVIEHLDRIGQHKSLSEMWRILKPNGSIVITTPNKPIYHLLTKFLRLFEYNPEHRNELSFSEMKSLVKKYFVIDLVDGKIGGPRFLGFLDKLLPAPLCWDILIVANKPTK